MYYSFHIISYIILSLLTIYLFVLGTYMSFLQNHYVIGIVKLCILGLLVYEIVSEGFKIFSKTTQKNDVKISYQSILISYLMFSIASVLTFFLHNHFGWQVVLSSSLIGIIGALSIKKHQVAIYCGSFVGMASSDVLQGYLPLIIATLISASLFNISKKTYVGFGGKLGAMALAGTFLTSHFFGVTTYRTTIENISISPLVIFYFVITALITYLLHKDDRLSTVMASSLVGVAFVIIINLCHQDHAPLLMISAFCGSFVGMSSKQRLKDGRFIVISALVGAIVFAYTQNFFIGLGGKLGAIAFGASITTSRIQQILARN